MTMNRKERLEYEAMKKELEYYRKKVKEQEDRIDELEIRNIRERVEEECKGE